MAFRWQWNSRRLEQAATIRHHCTDAMVQRRDSAGRLRRHHLSAVINLRKLICSEPADYANAIEPSGRGGWKIAGAIARADRAPVAGTDRGKSASDKRWQTRGPGARPNATRVLSFSEIGGDHAVNEDVFEVRSHPADPACWLCFLADAQRVRLRGHVRDQAGDTATSLPALPHAEIVRRASSLRRSQRMLAGFTSRWTIPWACTSRRPSPTSAT